MDLITKKARELRKSLAPSFALALGPEGGMTQAWVLGRCKLLVSLATRHHQLQEHACNRGLSSSEERREAEIEEHIRALCSELPCVKHKDTGKLERIRPHFQGDPRGATVKLVMPDGRYDDWGQTGICVPTARPEYDE